MKKKALRPVTLPYEEALKLGSGDVLIVNGIARLILQGPADFPPPKPRLRGHARLYFTFPIHSRSWTGRATTHYLWNDLKRVAYVPPRKMDTATMGDIEREWLESIGFNVDKEIKREIEWERDFIERCKRCPAQQSMLKPSPASRFVRVCCRLRKKDKS